MYLCWQGEKFLTKPTTDEKLGTSGRWVGTWTGVGVSATLQYAAADVHGAMDCDQNSFTLVWQ